MRTGRKHWFKVHWGWVVLGSSFVTLFTAFSIRIGAYSVLLPEMIKELQMTKTEAGMIKSAFSLTYVLSAPLMGWLTDRIGGRKVISFFCLFLGGGTFLMGKAETFQASAFFYSIVGLGAAATWVPITTLIQNWFGEKKRGVALGLLSPSYSAGFGLMGLILPLLVMEYNWRVCWFILGIAALALFFLNGLLLRDLPEKMNRLPWGESVEREREATLRHQRMGFLGILKEGKFWIIGISYFAISYGSYSLLDFVVTYGAMELKIPYRVASLFITVIALSSMVGGILLLVLSDYVGRKNSLIIIHLLVALSILWVVTGGRNIRLLIVGMGVFGFFYGPIWPMYAACARDNFPKEVTGTVFGLMTIFSGIGILISPLLTGYLADVTGTFKWSFALAGSISLMAAFLLGILKKPREFGTQEN